MLWKVSDEEWNRLPDETKQYYIDVEDGQKMQVKA